MTKEDKAVIHEALDEAQRIIEAAVEKVASPRLPRATTSFTRTNAGDFRLSVEVEIR